MPTILDTLQKGTGWLEKRGIEEARLSMQYLIAHVLDCDRMQLYVDYDRPLSEEELGKLRDYTKRRANREPLQHILGEVEFCDREFRCDPRALIPRPETEELVTQVVDRWQENLPLSPAILDLGCGSGVIGLSLAHLLAEKDPSITLADHSPEALDLARENSAQVLCDSEREKEILGRLEFIQSDLFSELKNRQFDLIVANLPYVPETDRPTLSPEVLRDPEVALFGGPDGTAVFDRFFSELPPHLKAGGKIALEFGINQSNNLQNLANSLEFEKISIKCDLSGTERFLFATQAE